MRHRSMSPTFLITGAEKSGTTWLHNLLNELPRFAMSGVKELQFFNQFNSNLVENSRYALGLDFYQRQFPGAERGVFVGESTPMYLSDPVAPARIYDAFPDIKLVAVLRDPVARAYSHYWMAKGKGHTKKEFSEIVTSCDPRFIGRGMYAAQLARYLKFFSKEQIYLIDYADLTSDPCISVCGLAEFLGCTDLKPGEVAEAVESAAANESKNGASELKFNSVQSLGRALAREFSSNSFLSPVWVGVKRSGLPRFVKSLNTRGRAYPPLDLDTARLLAHSYRLDWLELERYGFLAARAWLDKYIGQV